MFAGIVSVSVSVIADALNNLSDAGSSVVTFLGFKLASRLPTESIRSVTVVMSMWQAWEFPL